MSSQQRTLPQSKDALLKSYQKRLKDDVCSILANFTEIIKLAKTEEDTQVARATHVEQDHHEMSVRAANVVRAGESLLKLVSDLKQFLILNDFPSVNEAITHNTNLFRMMMNDCDSKLMNIRDDMAAYLYELEEDYYTCPFK
ncbi:PREDICTED: mediator of RNA polymerase II transcription subunit 22-like [Priapulus caudatus]|uniref:Mediator of RNA polymerase II transcription subunit 22 n=1 Tax=Priapulus caudatus TaxID=37621 RepID=A0ABM1ELU1_PRICU|nr:PREDICTED: mediator of RNA polymerase II transcription subunit 22-like [Priapulus caudatus]